MNSTFQPNKFHIISTSQSGFMIESLKTAQNVKSLPEDLSCSTSHARLYNFYDVPRCMLHMPRKSVKSSFTPIKRLAISTSEHGVMTILLKASQKPRRHAGIEDDLMNASPVGLPPSNVETSVHTYL